MKRNTQAKRPYSADGLARKLAAALARDFQSQLSGETAAGNPIHVLGEGTIAAIRGLEWHKEGTSDPYTFKCRYQMESLFKRYRFSKDLSSDSELEALAESQFLENQERLKSIDLGVLPQYMKYLLFVARGHCHQILGNYDLEEHLALCRFGKKASVGIPMRKACEAERYEVPISGSADHVEWFVQYLRTDPQAMSYILRNGHRQKTGLFKTTDALALTFVPKTFKSLRSIMPNTTIGSFYSDGLGKVIQKRLKAAHQDITRLQSRHGELARVASITGELVTADQSLASDNITLALVKAVVPDRWFEELNRGRIDKVRLPSGLEVNTPTFCTMGIGFTFPLQTLVFYVLLKAINEIYCHGRSLVSVYGDDLIYAKSMHPFVVLAFSRLGLRLNLDKTFADGCFRESCGSDFFAGVDVRPFLPRNEAGSSLTRNAYEALLYTWFNGLHRRWTRYECPAAFALLLGELDEVTRGILRVPEDFPDSSGIRCSSPYDTLDFPCRLTPVKFGKHGKVSFKYLRFQSDLQEENRHAPYLWRTLGDKCLGSDSFHDHHLHLSLFGDRGASAVVQRIEHITGVSRVSTPTIRNGVVGSANTRHSSRRGSKHPAVPCITKPGGAGRLLRQTGVSVHWTPKM